MELGVNKFYRMSFAYLTAQQYSKPLAVNPTKIDWLSEIYYKNN